MLERFRSKGLAILACLACFFVGVLFGLKFVREAHPTALRENRSGYTYINPLLLCQNYEEGDFTEFAPLKDKLRHITATSREEGNISDASVYFRDLESGRWTGLNENELYHPASLLKVPILIAYLKHAEKEPELLNEKLFYELEPGQAPPLIENFILTSGAYYRIEELLRGMIIDSDNSAKNILESRMDKAFLDDIYSQLGIHSPYGSTEEYQISTRTYALFFRVLYNGTLLGRDMSEKSLAMLAEVKFDKGLRAAIPSSMPIAHKYGYSIVKREIPRVVELSDCGIIYHPSNPYLLCIMARGNDPEVVARYIKDVAVKVYEFVEQR